LKDSAKMKPRVKTLTWGFWALCRRVAGILNAQLQRLHRLLNNSLLVVEAASNTEGRRDYDGKSHENTHVKSLFFVSLNWRIDGI
jgi:hypothetical protein